jgi:hypothetical protein
MAFEAVRKDAFSYDRLHGPPALCSDKNFLDRSSRAACGHFRRRSLPAALSLDRACQAFFKWLLDSSHAPG